MYSNTVLVLLLVVYYGGTGTGVPAAGRYHTITAAASSCMYVVWYIVSASWYGIGTSTIPAAGTGTTYRRVVVPVPGYQQAPSYRTGVPFK